MALIDIEQDGAVRKTSETFFRGPNTNFYWVEPVDTPAAVDDAGGSTSQMAH